MNSEAEGRRPGGQKPGRKIEARGEEGAAATVHETRDPVQHRVAGY